MAKQMNKDALVKKLKTVSNTQDSIPMLSLWIIHHKSHHKLIVDTWLEVLKKSKNSHRLTLMYLCNDVIQNCVRKNAPIYRDGFADVLPEAVTHLRDSSIKTNVQRVVKIWAKRGVYDAELTDQFLAALITNRAPEKLRNKLLVEYKTSTLIDEIKKFKALEDEIESDQKRLKAVRMDISSSDAIRKLKDKIGGEKFSKEFEESAAQLEVFLGRYEKYIEERKTLLDLLDRGTVYYHAQYHEAKIVVNAYQNFEGRVNKMKRGLDKVKAVLPGPELPPGAPSPGRMDDDMEMSDEDKELGSKPSKIVAVDTKLLRPTQRPTLSEKPASGATGEIQNSTESMLKLLATGLGSMKNSNESAAESLKRVVTGLVSRPGMRGATFNAPSESAAKPESVKGSLTIVRPIMDNLDEDIGNLNTSANIPPGGESPPSPTGSPELNIASPPRQQSLDSRLADIFNDSNPTESIDKGQSTSVQSDSDSDTDLIKRATDLLNVKSAVTHLPGLGDLDEVQFTKPQSEEEKPISYYNAGPPAEAYVATPQPQPYMKPAVPAFQANSAAQSSSSQTIPVIAGLTRPTLDGSSTPTLDEDPYASTSTITTMTAQYTSADAIPAILPPPQFTGDALGFLTKFMGQANKTELASEVTTSASSVAAVVTAQSSSTSNAIYDSWPPTTGDSNTNSNTGTNSSWNQSWGNQNLLQQTWPPNPPLPPGPAPDNTWGANAAASVLPPPPVFSWPPDSTASSPWQQYQNKYPDISPPTLAKPSSQAVSFSQSSSLAHTNATPTKRSLQSNSSDIHMKKSEWDINDSDFRSSVAHTEMTNTVSGDNSLSNTPFNYANRRNSNLITLSSEDKPTSDRNPPCTSSYDKHAHFSKSSSQPAVTQSSHYEPMAMFKSTLHAKSQTSNNVEAPHVNEQSSNQTREESASKNQSGMEEKTRSLSDGSYPSAAVVGQRRLSNEISQGKRYNSGEPFTEKSLTSPHNSNRFKSPRMERPHLQGFRDSARFPRPQSRGGHAPRKHFSRSDLPRNREMLAPTGRHMTEDELIMLEFDLLEEERRRAEMLRKTPLLEMNSSREPRDYNMGQARHSTDYRQRMARPPHYTGGPRFPRTRY